MATYLESLNILPPEYWEGGEAAGGEEYAGALKYLTDASGNEITDPLVGNPFLEAALAEGEAEWANTEEGGGFRPLTPYIPFDQRAAGLGDTPTNLFDPANAEMPANIWDPKAVSHFGGPQKIGQLQAARYWGDLNARINPKSKEFHPRVLDMPSGPDNQMGAALRSAGYAGSNRFFPYQDYVNPNDPRKGWMNLPWSLKTEAPMEDMWNYYSGNVPEYQQAYSDAIQPMDAGGRRRGGGSARFAGGAPLYGATEHTSPFSGHTWTSGLGPGSSIFQDAEIDLDPQDYATPLVQDRGGAGDYGQAYQDLYGQLQGKLGPFSPSKSPYFAQGTLERMAKLSEAQGMGGFMPNYSMDAVGEEGSPILDYADKAMYSAKPNIADLKGMNFGSYEKDSSVNPWMGYFSPERLGKSLDKKSVGGASDNITEEGFEALAEELSREAMGGADFGAGGGGDWGTGKWREIANILPGPMKEDELGFDPDSLTGLGPETGTTYLDAIKSGLTGKAGLNPTNIAKFMPYMEEYFGKNAPSLYRRDRDVEKGAVEDEIYKIMTEEKGPYKYKEEKLKDQKREFENIEDMYQNLRTEEPLQREAYLGDEASAIEAFNKVREDVVGSTTGSGEDIAGIGAGGLTYNVKTTQEDALADIKARLFEKYQGPEGVRTKKYEELYGKGAAPGSLAGTLMPGADQNIYKALVTDPYSGAGGYEEQLANLDLARTTGPQGLDFQEEKYTKAGTSGSSSEEQKAHEIYTKAWEDVEPAYQASVEGLKTKYEGDIEQVGEEREEDIKEAKQDYREDERDIDKRIRDLDLETTSARRKIRGFAGGGLVSGRRGRLGGEEYQKLLTEREALIAEKKAAKSRRKREIGSARTEAAGDIEDYTTDVESDVTKLQTGPEGVKETLEAVVFGTGEGTVEGALTKAEEDYWTKSEEAESLMKKEKEDIESDDVAGKSIKKQIEDDFTTTYQPDFQTAIAVGQQEMETERALAKSDILTGTPSELGNIPQLKADLFEGDDSLMSKALLDAPTKALEKPGDVFATEDIPTERKDFITDIETGGGTYGMALGGGTGGPAGLSDIPDYMDTSIGTNINLASDDTHRGGKWYSELFQEYENRLPDVLGEERARYLDDDLYSQYTSGGKGSMLAGTPGVHGELGGGLAPDFIPAKWGDWNFNKPMNFWGETYQPSVIGIARSGSPKKRQGIPGWGRIGSGRGEYGGQSGYLKPTGVSGDTTWDVRTYPSFNVGIGYGARDTSLLSQLGAGYMAPYGMLGELSALDEDIGWGKGQNIHEGKERSYKWSNLAKWAL